MRAFVLAVLSTADSLGLHVNEISDHPSPLKLGGIKSDTNDISGKDESFNLQTSSDPRLIKKKWS